MSSLLMQSIQLAGSFCLFLRRSVWVAVDGGQYLGSVVVLAMDGGRYLGVGERGGSLEKLKER